MTNEAFKSKILRSINDMSTYTGYSSRTSILTKILNTKSIKLDQVEDEDIVRLDPRDAVKMRNGETSTLLIYVATKEKKLEINGFSETIKPNTIVAIFDGQRNDLEDKYFSPDMFYRKDLLGSLAFKTLAANSDVVYALDLDALEAKYSSKLLKLNRKEAKSGATAMMSPKEVESFSRDQMRKYRNILAERISNSIDSDVEKYIITLTQLMTNHVIFSDENQVIIDPSQGWAQSRRGSENLEVSTVANALRDVISTFGKLKRAQELFNAYAKKGDIFTSMSRSYEREVTQRLGELRKYLVAGEKQEVIY